MISRAKALAILIAATAALIVVAFLLPRIPQWATYHDFADQRAWLGIPNFLDVVSNLPFAIVGLLGLSFLAGRESVARFHDPRERWPWWVVCFGLLLTAFGSSYYHWTPDNAHLVWDRLPMAVTFMALVAAVVTERISVRAGLWLLPVLVGIGMWSVLAWYASEQRGAGDLRFYAFIQVYGVVALLLVILLFPARYTRTLDFLSAVGWYALAKLLEVLDRQVYALGNVVGGHALKHIAAALAGWWIVQMVRKRELIGVHAPQIALTLSVNRF
jgi:hypothetical protein